MRPIERIKKPMYEMELSIYSVELCGKDLQSGSPIEVFAEGTDVSEMKERVTRIVLDALAPLHLSGKCFIEMYFTKNGEYFDRDDCWISVDLNRHTVTYFVE